MERKIQISNHAEFEKTLVGAGAIFTGEASVKDTYLECPDDEVLKLSETDGIDEVVHLKKIENGFEHLQAPDSYEKNVKKIVTKKRRFFAYKQYILSVELIDGLGEFFVVCGLDVPRSLFAEFGVADPEFISEPFCDLVK